MNKKKLPPMPLYPDGVGRFLPPILPDPDGSYTGRTVDGENPVQDADDL